MGVRKKCLKIRFAMGRKVTSSERFKSCSSACGQFTHMGFIRQRNILCETLGKVVISAEKYVRIAHSGLPYYPAYTPHPIDNMHPLPKSLSYM